MRYVIGLGLGVLGAMAPLAGGVSAQIQQLPPTSRSEAQSGALNNSLVTQERSRAATQQNQFEVNSLRNDLSRPVVPPSPGIGTGVYGR